MNLLITGSTGFVGKHVVKRALSEGHHVRASLRTKDRAEELRSAVGDGSLDIVELDLMGDAGWMDAMQGIDGLLHTASPVPIGTPKTPDDVIGPAVDGTRRAIEAAAAAGVPRVVVTSSLAAIVGCKRSQGHIYGPDDWTDPDADGVGTYARSKTQAERLARDIAATTPGMSLTTINPGFVFGAPLDGHWASSLVLIDRLLKGKDPLLPRLSFPSVSIHDVAEAHIRALNAPDGTRVVAAVRTLWLKDVATLVRNAAPGAKTARLGAPDWLVRVLARFDPTLQSVVKDLGRFTQTDCETLATLLGRKPEDPDGAITEAARALSNQTQ
jgi:dihydroflavonol-4-reductase